MDKSQFNELIQRLIDDPYDTIEFTRVFSIEENWRLIDKSIKMPRETGLTSDDCPNCFETIRAIFPKFYTQDSYFHVVCPHCNEKAGCHLEFEGYTSHLYFEDFDEDKHDAQYV